MKHTKGIFIFTRDRPETLCKTLDSLQGIIYEKYVIDDSVEVENQHKVAELCNSQLHCSYLGKAVFNQFTKQHHIDFPKFDFMLREVGNIQWNLGYARNFALLYSKALRLENVLFTDDDILVPNINLIEELFQSLYNYSFVGANITGLVDDSVLGHIATDIGIINERMLSGGFMAFNPSNVRHYFLNNYNEDWIWLFLQLKDKKYLQKGEVFQELSDPFGNYEKKIMFQEFGEIALDGVLDLYSIGSYDELVNLSFWKRIIKEREEYLNLLLHKSTLKNEANYCNIIKHIKLHSKPLNEAIFKKLFEKYFYNRNFFQNLYNCIG